MRWMHVVSLFVVAGVGCGGSGSGGSGGVRTGGGSGGSGGVAVGTTGAAGETGVAGSTGGGRGTGGAGGRGTGGAAGASSGGGASGACTRATAACVGMNSGCKVGSYYLYDNQWNCGAGSGHSCGPESAYGCTDGDGTISFVVTSNQPAGNTAVLTYPAMQDNFDSKPLLASFTAISATFAETSPHVGDYEVAWDCWFNDNGNELMIWVDTYNQVPGGSKVASNVSLGGRVYDVWTGGGGYVAFVTTTTFTSGTMDLLGIFNYAAAHGWLPAGSTVDQLSFGIEVCSTGGQDATWTIGDYAITAS
jgi:hypothetical protein